MCNLTQRQLHFHHWPEMDGTIRSFTALRSYKCPYRFCIFCKKDQSKLTRHIQTVHKDLPCVREALALPDSERIQAFDDFKKEGILYLNREEAKKDNPKYRTEKAAKRRENCVMCNNCKGFYSEPYFAKHVEKCSRGVSSVISAIPMEKLQDESSSAFDSSSSFIRDSDLRGILPAVEDSQEQTPTQEESSELQFPQDQPSWLELPVLETSTLNGASRPAQIQPHTQDVDSHTPQKASSPSGYKDPKRFCIFCKKDSSKLTRHIMTRHRDLSPVREALQLPRKERIQAFDSFKKEGILYLNRQEALKERPNFRREYTTKKRHKLVMCNICKGFYSQQSFSYHKQKCAKNESVVPSAAPTTNQPQYSDDVEELLMVL